MIYYTSDIHLFHKNVTKQGTNFNNGPFNNLDEMHETILKNWNNVVTNGDQVMICGDLCWKHNDESIALVSKLKGHKILCVGNHDSVKDLRYRNLFDEICDYKEITDNIKGKNYGVVLSHFPIMFWNKMKQINNDGSPRTKNYNILLYGHTHNSNEEKLYQQFLKYVNDNYGYGAMAFNVGCMHWNYTPVTLEQILVENNVLNSKVDALYS